VDEPSLLLSGIALGVLLARGWRIGIPVALAFCATDFLVSQSFLGASHILISSILGWIPFSRDRIPRNFFFRQRPSFELLFFSLLVIPMLAVIITEPIPTFDVWFIRSIRTALAMLILTPLTYLLIRRPTPAPRPIESGRKLLQTGLWVGLSSLILLAAFGPLLPIEFRSTRLAFTLFPILNSSAMLFGPLQHSVQLRVLSALAFLCYHLYYGP